MQVTEAIILAGGMGTRLRDAVPDLPKCMAPVNGKPFIYYVVSHLKANGIQHFIFSLGYRSEAFTAYIAEILPLGNYELVVEKEPLGTGGAIRFAAKAAHTNDVVIVNGDSIFKNNIPLQSQIHFSQQADCTLALKPMQQFDRYGAVELLPNHQIASFKEKKYLESGLINGGVYILNLGAFLQKQLPEKFSFETDYLQKFYTEGRIFGNTDDAYFIDIGIPEDYSRAQKECTE